MKTRGHDYFARLFKREGVRGLLAAGIFAAPLALLAMARAADWYPGNGAAMSSASASFYLPNPELLAQCGVLKTVKLGGGADYVSIQAAVDSLGVTLSTNSCVVVLDQSTYPEDVTIGGINTNGYRLRIVKDPTMTGAPTVQPGVASPAFHIASDSVTVRGINISMGLGSEAVWFQNSDAGEFSQSTITHSGGSYAIYFDGASTNTVSDVYVSNLSGDGLHFANGSNSNYVELSAFNTAGSDNSAAYFDNSASNTVTGSFFTNPGGFGVHFGNAAAYNTVRFSTMTGIAGTDRPAYYENITGAGNRIENSYIANIGGTALYFGAAGIVSGSTMISGSGGTYAVHFAASNSLVTGSYMSNSAGTAVLANMGGGNRIEYSTVTSGVGGGYYAVSFNAGANILADSQISAAGTAVYISNGSNGSSILRSTITGNGAGFYAVHNAGGGSILVTQSNLHNPAGTSVRFDTWGTGYNNISYSTITSGGANYPALYVQNSPNFTAADCYISGSTGTYLWDSNPAYLRHNVIISTWNKGMGVGFEGTGTYTISSNTIAGGQGGQALNLAKMGGGTFSISSNTISGGSQGVVFSPAFLTVSISSLTFQSLSPGATAIQMMASSFSLNISTVGFNSANIAVNINASAMVGGSINVYYPFGARASQYLAVDPGNRVQWPWPTAQSLLGRTTTTIEVGVGTNGALGYEVIASTADSYLARVSTATRQQLSSLLLSGLAPNTTYYVAAGALWDQTTYYYPTDMEQVTYIEDPASVYMDEVGSTTIVASAYAPGAAFTNMQYGQSGVAISTWGTYDVWGGTGNYWNTKAPMPSSRGYLGAAALGGKVYALGGFFGGVVAMNEEYDPALNAWVTKAPMPSAREYLAAVSAAGKIYAVGGSDGSYLGVNEAYDPAANTWATKAAMPTPRSAFAAASISGRLYALGGSNGADLNSNEEYDPVSDTWVTKTAMPTARAYLAAAALGGKVYAVGGFSGVSLGTCEEYDPVSDTWVTKAAMPTPRSYLAAAAIGGKLYALDGFNGSMINVNEAYDPVVDSWTTRAANATPRYGLAAAASGGRLYALGGTGGTNINAEYFPGVSRVFAGLKPNTAYTFSAKARSQDGLVGPESLPGVSTYTLATVALMPDGQTFEDVFTSSVIVRWSSGTAAGGYNGPDAFYVLQGSTATDFTGTLTVNNGGNPVHMEGLLANTTYHFRIKAYNVGGYTDDRWLALGSTVTLIEQPSGLYIDEVGTTTIVASAYAPSPAFTGLQLGLSAVRIAKNEVYDSWGSSGNYWNIRTAIPTGRSGMGVAALGGKVYTLGGTFGVSHMTKNEEYDPVSNSWTTKTALPSMRSFLAAAALGGKIYALGGWNGSTSLADNLEYNPEAGTWTQKAPMSGGRQGLAAAVAGGKLHAIGGNYIATHEAYDPVLNSWATRTAMPTPRGNLTAGTINGKIYAVGGWNGSVYYDVNEEYDPVSNNWVTKTPMPAPRAKAAAGVLGGKLVVVGGTDGATMAVAEEYDPGSDAWVTRASMPTPRNYLSAGVVNGRLYALGGSGSLTTNEELITGVSREFVSLTPNTIYTFKAKARNQAGAETDQSVTISTRTLAAVALPETGPVFGAITASSAAVRWSPGTAAGGYNGPWASYLVVASTSPDYLGTNISSYTYSVNSATLPLAANTSYYFRIRAYNAGGMTDYRWLALGSTVTTVNPPLYMPAVNFSTYSLTLQWGANGNGPDTWYTAQAATDAGFTAVLGSSVTRNTTAVISGLPSNTLYYTRVRAVNQAGTPTAWVDLEAMDTDMEPVQSVYFDEIGASTITASAYSPTPAFSGLGNGSSGVNVTTGTLYGDWNTGADSGDYKGSIGTARYMLAGAALGGKLYNFGGSLSGVAQSRAQEYDPVADVWTDIAYLPTARFGLAAAAAGGKIYALGGSFGSGAQTLNEEYDPAQNAWTTRRPMLEPRFTFGAVTLDGKVYAIGSGTNNERYDPETDAWVLRAPMLAQRESLAVAAVGGKIYAIGGSGPVSDNEEYDPALNAWITRAPMPTARLGAGAAAVGGKIFIIGGFDGGSFYSENEEYDPAVNVWIGRAGWPARYFFGTAALGGRIYGFGGHNGSEQTYTYAYNPGVAKTFGGLKPNTLYNFKARSRNQTGDLTPDSLVVSTRTLAAVAPPAGGQPFTGVYLSSVAVAWSSGTAAIGYNGPGASYLVAASTSADYLGNNVSSYTFSVAGAALENLLSNATYYFRVQAYNSSGYTDYSWLVLGSTVTRIETPTSVYVDEVGITTIVASAYAASPAFTGLERGISGVAITTASTYEHGNSTGNYWSGKGSLQYARSMHAAAAVNGKIFAAGGFNGSYVMFTEEYDPVINIWGTFPRPYLPTLRKGLAAAAVGGKVYFIGGEDSGGLSAKNEVLDPVANTFTARASMPAPRNAVAAAALGGKVYVVGGNDGVDQTGLTEAYDPDTDSWTTRAPLGTPREGVALGAVNGRLYAVGGFDGMGGLGVTEEYDPVLNSWTTRAVMPWARNNMPAAAVGGKLFVYGGSDGMYKELNHEYDPVSNSWVTRSDMPVPRWYHAGVALYGKVYAIGGHDGGYLNNVHVYDPGTARAVTGLKPNTLHTFKAKARNLEGALTGESVSISTYTLAAVALPQNGQPFGAVYASSAAVNWSSGTAAIGYNGPGARYLVVASTSPDYLGTNISSSTYNVAGATLPLAANTTYFFRVQAYNAGGMTDYSWLVLGSTSTRIETPTDIYFDEVTVTTIVASAYAPGAAFTGLERGLSGVNLSLDGAWGVFGSTGNYWQIKADMMNPRGTLGGALLGGKIYTVGGDNGGGSYYDFNTEYDPAANTWAIRAALPTAREAYSAAAVNGKLYVLGGSNGTRLGNNDEYDPVSNTWATRAAMPTPRTRTACAVVNNKIYVVGGDTNSDKNEAYDPATDTWATRANMPVGRYNIGAAALRGKIYVVGSSSNVNDEYDPATDTWATRAPVPTARHWPSAAVLGGKLHAIGGYTTGPIGNNEMYDPEADIWTIRAPLPTPRRLMTAVAYRGRLFVMGGSESAQANEAYVSGAAEVFAGLTPNTLYNFRAMARNQAGAPTPESALVSTYTLAALPLEGSPLYMGVSTGAFTVRWLANNNPAGTTYFAQISDVQDFASVAASSVTFNLFANFGELGSNTTYYARVAAVNGGGVPTEWLALGSTVTMVNPPLAQAALGITANSITAAWAANGNPGDTVYDAQIAEAPSFSPLFASTLTTSVSFEFTGLPYANTYYYLRVNAVNRAGSPTAWVPLASTATAIEAPVSVYFDEIRTTSVTVSAYAPSPAFTGLRTWPSGALVSIGGTYPIWRNNGDFWESKNSMPTQRYALAAVSLGGKIYALGGRQEFAYLNTNQEYDPVNNSWTTKTGMPTGRHYLAAAVVNGRIYAMGGTSNGTDVRAENEEYDPVADTWISRAPLPAARADLKTAVIGGRIYAVGGTYDHTVSVGDNAEYDPATDDWVSKADMPTARRGLAVAAVSGKLYAAGGYTGSHLLVTEEYDPSSDFWTTKAAMPAAQSWPGAVSVGGKMYVIGGHDGSSYLTLNREYDPLADSWRTRTSMSTARNTLGAAAIFGKIYALGGTNGSVDLATNQVYEPGVVSTFTALTPNTIYSFKAKARNRLAVETAETVAFSTYTMAAVALPPGGNPFAAVHLSSAAVVWSSGTAAWGFNGPGASYLIHASTAANFSGVIFSSRTADIAAGVDLERNTSYYFRAQAYNAAGVTDYSWLVLGSTATQIETPTGINFTAVTPTSIDVLVQGQTGFSNLSAGQSSIAKALNGVYAAWFNSTAENYTGLTPNTQYTFSAKARNIEARETQEVVVSTWTLAVTPAPAPQAFGNVFTNTLWAFWQAGGNPGGTEYRAEVSTATDFSGPLTSSVTVNLYGVMFGLLPNTTYYGRVAAVNGAGIPSGYLSLGSTVTFIQAPTAVYADEVTTFSVTMSAYASAFTGLERGLSAVRLAKDGVYEAWGSSGNYWAARASLSANTAAGAAAALGGKVHLAGGWAGGPAYVTHRAYDPAANSWADLAPLLTGRHNLALAALGNKLYAVGGAEGLTNLAVNEEYDPEANAWAARAPMPTARKELAAAAAGGKIYALGGSNGSALAQNEEYDPAYNMWTARTPMPTARYGLTAVVIDGQVYAAGGAGGMAVNEKYDPALDTWITRAPLPTGRYNHGAAAVGGKLYAVGGFNGAALLVNEYYDPAVNTWTAAAPLSAARYHIAVAAARGRVYAMGGVYVNTSEEYEPGVARAFSGLQPNTQYSFKAKARNQEGTETAESVTVTTYTLAAVAVSTGSTFLAIFPSSVTVAYSSGTDAGGYNGPGASYQVEASTAPDFTGGIYLGAMYNPDDIFRMVDSLGSNTTYHFRVQAWNAGGFTDYRWLPLGTTVTHAISPNAAAQPFDGVNQEGVTIQWGRNGNSEGTAYRLQVSSYANFSEVYSTVYPLYASTTAIGGLTPNTTWHARAAAVSYSGVETEFYVIGSTLTKMPVPSDVLFPSVSTRAITAAAWSSYGFPNLAEGLSGLAYWRSGFGYGGWAQGAQSSFSGMTPNTQYSFRAKARSQTGEETAESPEISTFTMATVAMPHEWPLFTEVWTASTTVHWSSGTAADGFNGPGAEYKLEVSQAPGFVPSLGSTSTLDLSWPADLLWPNTTHYFRVRALNSVDVLNPDWLTLGSTSTLANPVPSASVFEVWPTTVAVAWSTLPPTPSSDTCEGYLVEASTASDFTGVIKSSATGDHARSVLTVMNLFAESTYYFRVGSLNHNGVPNYTLAGSTWTPPENIPPVITSYESYDYAWYGALPARTYDIDFQDAGGSALENFQVKATTGPLETGAVNADWTDILAGIDADDFTADWTLTQGFWDLLADGTNFISVQVFDGSGNTDVELDAFLVFKDTTPPAIGHTYDSQVWRSTHGFSVLTAVTDPHSGIDRVQYSAWSAPAQGGSELIPWSQISAPGGAKTAAPSLPVSAGIWDLLVSGTNYFALRAWDYSVPANTNTWVDAYAVLKDTIPPSGIMTLAGVELSTWSARLAFSAPDEGPSGIDLFALQYASYTVAWATSAVAGSTHVYISTYGVTAGEGQRVGIEGLGPNTTYYFRAWSRDQAGNWSTDSNSDPEVTLAEAPVPSGGQLVYVSSIALSWVTADAAGWQVEASTANDFTGIRYSSSSAYPGEISLAPQGLSPNTTYYVRSASLNWPGVPNYGYTYEESTFVTTPASAAVYAVVSSVAITVEWLANGNGPGTRYTLDISSDEFVSVLASTFTLPAGASPFAHTFEGLAPNTTHWFRVQALGNRGDLTSFLALGSTVTTPVPPLLTGYTLWASSAAVTWDANGNGAGTLYRADLSTAADFTGALLSSVTGSAFDFSMGPITPNTTYYLRLRAVSSSTGQSSPYVGDVKLALAAAPEGIGAWTIGPNNIGIYWDAEGNPGGLGLSAWSTAAGLPAPRYSHAAALAGDIAFIAGGYDGSAARAEVWYAPVTAAGVIGAWTPTRPLPAARYAHSAVALQGRLYVLGGYDGSSARAEVWSAPISSSGALGGWVAEAPLPLAVYAHAFTAGENTLYVLGGYNGGARDNVWYTRVNADGTLSGWTAGPALTEALYSAAAAMNGSHLYFSGGYDGLAAKTAVRRSAVDGAGAPVGWVSDAALPSGVHAHAMEAVPGALIISGGNGGTLARTATLRGVLAPSGAVAAWHAGPALPAARQAHTMASRGSRLLVLGGYDGAAARTDGYYSTLGGTEFRLAITGAPFTETPWMAAGWQDAGSLVPNSYYVFRPLARNYAGLEAEGAVTFSTFTHAAQPSSAPVSGVFISSAQANWFTADNPAGTRYEAQLSSDAAHTELAFSSVTVAASAVFTGLDDNYTYYARVRAFNGLNVATAWTVLGSTTTRSDPALDFSSPTITVNAADPGWLNHGNTLYDIDFADTGGAWLSSFEVGVSATPADPLPSWTPVLSGMNTENYAAGWALPAGLFDLLAPGTSYMSVRAWDANGNSTATVDAFMVLKDTSAPVITDGQSGEDAWRMDDGGAIYDVDFADLVSGLAAIEYSASPNQGSGDAAGLPWTPIVSISTGLKVYAGNWALDFAALPNDATNYISVRARDLAGNAAAVTGIDMFKILKYVAGPEIGLTAPDAGFHSALAAIAGTASDARSHAAAAVEVSVREDATGKYWNGAGFLAASPAWQVAAGTGPWTYAHGITWLENYAYQVVARASDTAGNYSLNYATRNFTYDSLAPVIALLAPADGASVNSAFALSGTAYDASGFAGLAVRFNRLADGLNWDFSAATWTVAGSSAAVAPAAGWSYTLPALLAASLETGASYYYTLYAVDNSSPVRSAPFYVYGSTFGFIDNTAPAAVTSLSASSGSAPGNIQFNWTAPGDDGALGLILHGQYRVQYSTASAIAFSTADAQVTGDFTAWAAGAARAGELTGLAPGTEYFLRLWTRDDAGNWSALSNGATAQASPFPDSVRGHVLTVSSAGITGVLVEAFDASGLLRGHAYTVGDGSGTYIISGLPAGSYRVQATWEADDIISSVGTDGIPLGASNADFTLSITYDLASIGGELAGYRLSALGFRVQGVRPQSARVELYQRGRLVATAPVDANGKFLISNLLPGKYVLKVPDPAGGSKELSVRVKPGEALVISPLGELLKTDRVYVYPNPARRTAAFHIESELSPVRKQLAIFDITGRLITKIDNPAFRDCSVSVCASGNVGYEAVWEIPAKVASGVYLYSVHVKFEPTGEHKNVVRKFAIVK